MNINDTQPSLRHTFQLDYSHTGDPAEFDGIMETIGIGADNELYLVEQIDGETCHTHIPPSRFISDLDNDGHPIRTHAVYNYAFDVDGDRRADRVTTSDNSLIAYLPDRFPYPDQFPDTPNLPSQTDKNVDGFDYRYQAAGRIDVNADSALDHLYMMKQGYMGKQTGVSVGFGFTRYMIYPTN